jgi:hypothetical protein
MGAAMRANAAGGNSTSAATGVGNPGEEAAAQAGGAAQPASTTGGDTGEVPGVTTQAGATPATSGGAAQPAKPAAPAANKAMTPAITAYASRMGLLKNNKPDVAAIKKFQQDNGLKADGIIGPNTAGAIISASGSNMGGGGGGPAPSGNQFAKAPAAKPAGGAAQPATKPGAPNQSNAETARLARQNAAVAAGGAAQPAAPTPPPPPPNLGQFNRMAAAENVKSQDDAILERIRKALFR